MMGENRISLNVLLKNLSKTHWDLTAAKCYKVKRKAKRVFVFQEAAPT